MHSFHVTVTCSFGLEALVKRELMKLNLSSVAVENGSLYFQASLNDIAICNLWLRCADRVYITLVKEKVENFDDFFTVINAIRWEEMVPVNGKIYVTAKSKKSVLSSVPVCQSMGKKAILDAMRRRYKKKQFSEDGPLYHVDLDLHNNLLAVNLNTSGPGLHKRGYRLAKGEAPLRETLAASMVYISRWQPGAVLADPFCGSGTIPVEAALIGNNIAPGINRNFDAENWTFFGKGPFINARKEARDLQFNNDFKIFASDIDKKTFIKARENAERAGVSTNIIFQKKPVKEFSSKEKNGYIITNPPHGKRMGNDEELKILYSEMHDVFISLENWSWIVLSAHEDFEKLFGLKSQKNRKIYNGPIKSYIYQYNV